MGWSGVFVQNLAPYDTSLVSFIFSMLLGLCHHVSFYSRLV